VHFNLPIETEATEEEETVSCEITTPFQSVDSPTLQHPESQLIGGRELMETSEPFNLPIDIETTLEEDSVSSDTTTTYKSVALPPQQDPETDIISGSDLIETSGPLNLQIETETTVEESEQMEFENDFIYPPLHSANETTNIQAVQGIHHFFGIKIKLLFNASV